jgi:multicomponent Na+:H+ antiporter subunit D
VTAYIELARLHAPLLMLVAPLCGAALVFLAQGRLAWGIGVLTAFATAFLSVDAAMRALLEVMPLAGTLEGVLLYADGIAIFASALIALALTLLMLGSGAFVRDFPTPIVGPALALTLCAGAGWIGAVFARDLVGVFAAVEIAWLASVGVLALSPDRGALNGASRMLVAGGVSSALFLLGIALTHSGVGAIDLAALPSANIRAPGLAAAGVGLVLLSVALKAGIAPLNFWIGAAYGRAGRLAALLLGAIGAVGALCVLVRLASFALPAPALGEGVSITLATLGATSVLIGSVQAVGARNLLRLAAYSGAAQAGVALLCAALGSPAGFAAALVQIFAMLVATLALMGGVAFGAGGAGKFDALDGLGRRAPLASAAITAAAISLMGAPLTIGFLGRWRLVEAGVGAGWWWAAGAVIVTSLAGVFYGGRLVERIYFRRVTGTHGYVDGELWRFAGAPMMLAAICAVAWGLAPDVLLRAADGAAALMAGAP